MYMAVNANKRSFSLASEGGKGLSPADCESMAKLLAGHDVVVTDDPKATRPPVCVAKLASFGGS
jgi:hypothetical protein